MLDEKKTNCRSEDRGLISRRGFLSFLSAGAVGIGAFAWSSRSGQTPQTQSPEPDPPVDQEVYPMRASHMKGVIEPDGRVLVTPHGAGEAAPCGCRLNPVGSHVWDLADGTRSMTDIAREIGHSFHVPSRRAARDAESLIEALADNGFLVMLSSPVS